MGQVRKPKWMVAGMQNPLEESSALYEAALTEFSERSFRDASLNGILKAAGMNKGSFYYRFHDKMELYLSLLRRVGMEKVRLFQEFDIARTADGFFDEFRQMTIIGLKLSRREPRYAAFSRRILEEEPAIRETITANFGDLGESILTDMVRRAKDAGEFRRDLPTETVVFVIETLLNHLDSMIPYDWEESSVLVAVDRLLDVIRFGVGAKEK